MHNSYRLGVTYNVFNGEEILPYSVKSIRNQVDYINIVYQMVSWTGNEANEKMLPILNKLKSEGLVDKLILYKPEFNGEEDFSWARKQTIRKKQVGINDLKINKCTHCLIMDADELYREEQFEVAKIYCYEHGITHSCCNIYDYKFKPTIRTIEAVDYAVPFILKMGVFSRLRGIPNLPCRVDPFRSFTYIPGIHKFYFLHNISMHHMTGIRNDINTKIKNTKSNYLSNEKGRIKQYKIDYEEMQLMDETQLFQKGFIVVKENIIDKLAGKG